MLLVSVMQENDPSELYLTFAVDEEQLGQTLQRELKPGGANIPIDNDNKDEYIKLVQLLNTPPKCPYRRLLFHK